MDDIDLFLRHAIQLERDAAQRFEDLMHAMRTSGNRELERLFRRLGELSRLHLKAATARGGFHDLPVIAPDEFEWPDGLTPEAAGWEGVDDLLDGSGALQVALAGEQRGLAYYEAIAGSTTDPEVRRTAREFADEEAQHVSELKRWIARSAEGTATPSIS